MSVKNGKESNCREASSCQFLVDDHKCGETNTLEIMQEFKELYETKLKQIDVSGKGDCITNLQAKLELQHEWIKDLTEQNEMLVRTVEELECEATERVLMLEEKLKNSANVGSQVMKKYRELNIFNLDGTFLNLKGFLGGNECNEGSILDTNKGDELVKQKNQEIEQLKQSMLDMRIALTNEVAEKHDTILTLRRDVQQLENQCWQANQHNQFKEDIIKELRKEIKQFKNETRDMTLSSGVPPTPPALIHAVLSISENQSTQLSPDLSLSTQDNNYKLKDSTQCFSNNSIRNETNRSASNEDKRPFIHMQVKSSTQDLFYQQLLTKGQKNYDNKKQLQTSPNTDTVKENKQKHSENLTINKVLHEQYSINKRGNMCGSVQCFNELLSKKDFTVPKHIPVKMIVTNIERGVLEKE